MDEQSSDVFDGVIFSGKSQHGFAHPVESQDVIRLLFVAAKLLGYVGEIPRDHQSGVATRIIRYHAATLRRC